MLMEEGQGHVIAFWAEVGTNDERKKALGHQLSTIDGTYPGGLRAYVKNGKALLAAACRGDNPYAGFVPEVPEGTSPPHLQSFIWSLACRSLAIFHAILHSICLRQPSTCWYVF